MKTGLVLEGGAMRGLFSAGVMDVLMEHQITFDGAIGVSAGAAFGCNDKSRQPGRVIRYNTADLVPVKKTSITMASQVLIRKNAGDAAAAYRSAPIKAWSLTLPAKKCR